MSDMTRLLQQMNQWHQENAPKREVIHPDLVPKSSNLAGFDLKGFGLHDLETDEDYAALGAILKKLPFPRCRSFDLGTVKTGPALMQSSACYRVVRQKGGLSWKIYVDGVDCHNGENFIGEYASNEIIYLVQEYGYELTLLEWISIGWRPSPAGEDRR
jgi:hypothetical protein